MSILTAAMARVLFLPTLVLAAALLAKGHAGPGDGFSAGLVAAMAVLIRDAAAPGEPTPWGSPESIGRRIAVGVAGILPLLALAVVPMVVGQPPLTQFPRQEDPVAIGTLQLDTGLAFDTAIAWVVLLITVDIVRLMDPRLPEPRP